MSCERIYLLLVILFSLSPLYIKAQTKANPIEINVSDSGVAVAPGGRNYVTITFSIPKGIWLGAEKGDARTPPGTVIKVPEIDGFQFDEPLYPESIKEWVPAKIGTTKVFKEKVVVVIPYSIASNVNEGEYEFAFKVTYTPGYNAGRLATHNDEIYTTSISVNRSSNLVDIPQPSLSEVDDDFFVKPETFDNVSGLFKFMFNPINENGGLAKSVHTMLLDKPGHGKSIRMMPFPFLSSTNITGSSIGMGASLFNSTKEGTMTGMVSVSGYSNNLIGGAVGVRAISCPGAYHNYQLSAFFGGEGYRNVTLHYENFTLSNSSLGLDFNFKSTNEPRMRYFGVGSLSQEGDETAYEKTNFNTALDLYAMPMQHLRLGVGLGYDNYSTDSSFDEVVITEGISLLENSPLSESVLGLDGANVLRLKANVIYDHRDQEFAPSRGFYGKMTVSRNQLSGDLSEEIASSFYGLDVDMRQYLSGPSQKMVVLMRAGLSLKSESNLPFYMLSSLGGPNSIRAYDFERFLGQHSAFASTEMRYTVSTISVLGYPMSIEMGVFLDVGQVFGDGESFGDELNVDPGISMRMINKPNVGLIFNYAYGADGGYFTGGIGLPF